MSKKYRLDHKFKTVIEVYHLISKVGIAEKLLKGTKVQHYKVTTHYRLSDNTHREMTTQAKLEYPRQLMHVINNKVAFEEITVCRGMKNPTRTVLNNELLKFRVNPVVIYV